MDKAVADPNPSVKYVITEDSAPPMQDVECTSKHGKSYLTIGGMFIAAVLVGGVGGYYINEATSGAADVVDLEFEEGLELVNLVYQGDCDTSCDSYGGVMQIYPDYDGDYIITGTVKVATSTLDEDKLRIDYNLRGLEISTYGGLHIHIGTTCLVADMVLGHYYDADTDPWTTYWYSDANGIAAGFFEVDSGYNISENLGHALVVHLSSDEDSERAACGLVGEAIEYTSDITTYPDYTGDYTVTGNVSVADVFDSSSSLRVSYDLSGLETSTSGGLHIHVGVTCDDSTEVGGHYYDSDVVTTDPWTTTWESDSDGDGFDYFTIYTGYNITLNWLHAVVVHDSDGTRIGCGTLDWDIEDNMP